MNLSLLDRIKESFSNQTRRTGVLVIDMQPYFLQRINIIDSERLLAAQAKVLNFATSQEMPVAYIEAESAYTFYGETDERVKTHFPKDAIRITKVNDDGFTNPELEKHLRIRGVTQLILTGIYANYCVWETLRGGIAKGFKFYTAPQLLANKETQQDEFDLTLQFFESKTLYYPNYLSLLQTFKEAFQPEPISFLNAARI